MPEKSMILGAPYLPAAPVYTRSKSEVIPCRKRLSFIRPRIKSSASKPEFSQIPEIVLTRGADVGNLDVESRGDCNVIKEDTLATPREDEGL